MTRLRDILSCAVIAGLAGLAMSGCLGTSSDVSLESHDHSACLAVANGMLGRTSEPVVVVGDDPARMRIAETDAYVTCSRGMVEVTRDTNGATTETLRFDMSRLPQVSHSASLALSSAAPGVFIAGDRFTTVARLHPDLREICLSVTHSASDPTQNSVLVRAGVEGWQTMHLQLDPAASRRVQTMPQPLRVSDEQPNYLFIRSRERIKR